MVRRAGNWGPGRERLGGEGGGRVGPGCQVTSGELLVSCGKVLTPEFRGGLGQCFRYLVSGVRSPVRVHPGGGLGSWLKLYDWILF